MSDPSSEAAAPRRIATLYFTTMHEAIKAVSAADVLDLGVVLRNWEVLDDPGDGTTSEEWRLELFEDVFST
ncbi:MAG: hypothetical protein ACT4OV_11395 [Microthrixaceae bacterium]